MYLSYLRVYEGVFSMTNQVDLDKDMMLLFD